MNILIADTNGIRCLGIETIVKSLFEVARVRHVRYENDLMRYVRFNIFSHIILSTSVSKKSLSELISNIKHTQNSASILLLSESNEIIFPQSFVKSCAEGLLSTDETIEKLENGLKLFLLYGNYIPPALQKEIELTKKNCLIKKKNKIESLSILQSRVLQHLSAGVKVVHVASKMGISTSAVSTHKKRAFQKLDISHISEFISIVSTNQKFV